MSVEELVAPSTPFFFPPSRFSLIRHSFGAMLALKNKLEI